MATRTYVMPKAGAGTVNLRAENRIDPANLIGMVNEGTKLEYVAQIDSWYVAKVYVSTQGAEIVNTNRTIDIDRQRVSHRHLTPQISILRREGGL